MRLSLVLITVLCTIILGMLGTSLIGLDVHLPVFAMQWFLAWGVLMLFFVIEDHLLDPKPWGDGWTRARTGSLLLSIGLIALGLQIGLVQRAIEFMILTVSAAKICALIYWALSTVGLLLLWFDSGNEYSRRERTLLSGFGAFIATHVVYSVVSSLW
jgi:hypothetical protein